MNYEAISFHCCTTHMGAWQNAAKANIKLIWTWEPNANKNLHRVINHYQDCWSKRNMHSLSFSTYRKVHFTIFQTYCWWFFCITQLVNKDLLRYWCKIKRLLGDQLKDVCYNTLVSLAMILFNSWSWNNQQNWPLPCDISNYIFIQWVTL